MTPLTPSLTALLVGPKSLKSIRDQGRISCRGLQISVPQIMRQRSGFLALNWRSPIP
jgi:hypothetical protein